jgi:hypothetical protein
MAKIVNVKECLGVILYGRYLSGSWGCSLPEGQRFELPFDFFVHSGYDNMNLDTLGVVPSCHAYRLHAAGVYTDAEDAELCALLETAAEIDFVIQGHKAYHTTGLRSGVHTLLPRADALAELRGEAVDMPKNSQVSFTLGGPVVLETAVREAAKRGVYVELLGWASGLWVRDIL